MDSCKHQLVAGSQRPFTAFVYIALDLELPEGARSPNGSETGPWTRNLRVAFDPFLDHYTFLPSCIVLDPDKYNLYYYYYYSIRRYILDILVFYGCDAPARVGYNSLCIFFYVAIFSVRTIGIRPGPFKIARRLSERIKGLTIR